ncbi:MAG: EVE domain-containing protein [Chloroflexota bacterium]|nr:EVE domain-containing protein [Chloroflexota bacterium]
MRYFSEIIFKEGIELSNTYWLINLKSQEYIKNSSNKRSQIFLNSDRKKVTRMSSGDKLIFYISDKNCFVGISEIKSDSYEELNNKTLSIKVKKSNHLNMNNSVDGDQIGPSLDYVKRWAPERWRLAMVGSLHIVSQNDYNIINASIKSRID